MERKFAVAIRDEDDLFLWLRIKRDARGDVYCIIPTGRAEPEWKRWNPHVSQHRDGHVHHKSFWQTIFRRKRQKPDPDFKGTEQLVTRSIASDEPRSFGVPCNPDEFSEVMEVPISIISPLKYETHISVDLTEPDGEPIITPGSQIIAQHTFKDSVPWILVTVFTGPPLPAPE
jgi:hypothetical protein